MSKKLSKKMRRNYVRKGPTYKELLLKANDTLNENFRKQDSLEKILKQKEQQLFHTNQIVDAQNLEISILKETNVNLHEVINVLGRRERMVTQDRIFDAYSKTMNQTENLAVKSDCCGFKDPD